MDFPYELKVLDLNIFYEYVLKKIKEKPICV